jgi:pantoate--beta-alanine ligase
VIRRIPEIQFAKVRLIGEIGVSDWSLAVKTLKMILFKRSDDLQNWLLNHRNPGIKTGFTPTMGALHSGHLHLIESSKLLVDITICSIFVNPVQFNDPEDFKKYPVSLENDIQLLEKAGTDILFLPSVEEIYPFGSSGLEKYDLGPLESILEGRYRPGHFQGVCQVMQRLLTKVKPDHLIMGQKDYQQCMVVQRLIQIMRAPVQFHSVGSVRDVDGLALSSRNKRLNPDQRKNATAIYRALKQINDNIRSGDLQPLIQTAVEILTSAQFKIDYITIANANSLKTIKSWDGKEKAIALIAAFQGDVRLIDNMLLN